MRPTPITLTKATKEVPADTGPSWVASIVNAIGKSKYWKSIAIVVLWDDWGGFYDHVPPPFYDQQGGLGFRFPMIIISPYVTAHVEHTQYETTSVLQFIEKTGTSARSVKRMSALPASGPPSTSINHRGRSKRSRRSIRSRSSCISSLRAFRPTAIKQGNDARERRGPRFFDARDGRGRRRVRR